MKNTTLLLFAAVGAAILASTPSTRAGTISVGTITYDAPATQNVNPDDYKGTGKGVVTGVLSLQVNGSLQGGNTTVPPGTVGEGGSTEWNGSTRLFSTSLFTPEFTAGSQITDTNHFYARSNTEIYNALQLSNDTLGLIFQPNQSGNNMSSAIHVDYFAAVVYDGSTGNIVRAYEYASDGTAAAPHEFLGVGQGTSGYIFKINLAGLDFFGGNYYMGMFVGEQNAGTTSKASYSVNGGVDTLELHRAAFSNADDGADNFFFAQATPSVPVPAAAWTGITALAGLGLAGKLRKKLHRD